MRNEIDDVKTFEVLKDIEVLGLSVGDKLRWQASVSNKIVYGVYPHGVINHGFFIPKSIVESRTEYFKVIPNFSNTSPEGV